MRKFFSTLFIALISIVAYAQSPVNWTIKLIGNNTDSPAVLMTATIDAGYHMYSTDNDPMAGMPLEFFIEPVGATLVGTPVANKQYTKHVDDIMGEEHFYEGSVTFTQKLKPTAANFTVDVEIKGQACDDTGCVQIKGAKSLKGTAPVKVAEEAPAEEVEEEDKEVAVVDSTQTLAEAPVVSAVPANNKNMNDNPLWNNVETQLTELGDSNAATKKESNLFWILLQGFLGGLIALVTPCVWPMIPMTVSFFLKQNKDRAKSIRTAMIYGVSIIVIYVAAGLIITAIFGASALNALSTSAVFNIIFFLLLVVFAISFLGGFELTLPSSWTNKMDSKVDSTTGLLSVFFMAFTLVLVSFSCTGPIIGTLLVQAADSNDMLAPTIGMFGFALALALPFTVFAIFPTMLKSMPKSGGWLNSVKVVLGFLELALALKFLSVADLAYGWRILDREVFIALWIIIFALLGIYLLGKITFPHDSKVEKTGVTRFMLAVISLSFAVYMLPGLWGAPLNAISAFAPPSSTQDFSLYEGDVHAVVDDYDEGMALAKKLNKPVLVDFSGHGCVNCRKLEGAVWTNQDVKNRIDNDFILITLMVDEKADLSEKIKVTERNGEPATLRTVGDKWSFLQRYKFGANAQPYHVILDNEGNPLVAPMDYDNGQEVEKYLEFLNTGLERYNNK